jgi:hypothetical protein
MIISFNSIGLKFLARVRYEGSHPGNYFNPPEPGELVIESLEHVCTGADASFLLDSKIVDQIYEDAYDSFEDAVAEEREEARVRRHQEEVECQFS